MKQKNISLSKLFRDHPYKKEVLFLSKKDNDLKKLFEENPNFRPFRRPKGFEGLVRLITEQQLSVASAKAIFLRVKKLLTTFNPKEFLNLTNEDLQKTGLSRQKINYCQILAKSINSGELSFRSLHKLEDDKLRTKLCEIKGIGDWTAECYMLASLSRENIWPIKDLGLQAALHGIKKLKKRPNEEEMILLAKPWEPYRSIVANVLWASYD